MDHKILPVGSSGFDLAKSIGPGLARDAVAITDYWRAERFKGCPSEQCFSINNNH